MIEELISILPFLIPLVLIELGFRVYSIIDIYKAHRETLFISKTAWTIIVALISFGWVIYLLVGRKDVTLVD